MCFPCVTVCWCWGDKRQGISFDDWEFIEPNFILNNLLYEATIVVWKEKIRHDRIRPPSIIHYLLDGQVLYLFVVFFRLFSRSRRNKRVVVLVF